mmetsp:Transcript_8971/g.13736  ORF Transcript_8971/g.13736 Transcript_8971/m.13736 type:complete len:96 (+) Transcript_8971:2-289(+)
MNSLTYTEKWPISLWPTITIQTCRNCANHAWCTRHNEEKYLKLAELCQEAIKIRFQHAKIDPSSYKVLVNQFHPLLASPRTEDVFFLATDPEDHS